MTQPRNRDVGRGGHPTQFASRERRDSVTTLAAPREVADNTDIDRYFAGGVDRLHDAPWAETGVWPSLASETWAGIEPVEMAPTGLYRTQKRLLKGALKRHAAGGEADGGDPHPWVVRYGGRDYVIDGHHRVASAVHNEDVAIVARLLDMDS